MLEKIRAIPFIDESRAVKVSVSQGKMILERTDKVLWGSEVFDKPNWSDVPTCYVEADKFFVLLESISSLVNLGTCLEVTLSNGAKYQLPFLDVKWNSIEMPNDYSEVVTFKLADLMLCTLTNLIKPEFQCIRIDEKGAVSCDFVSACITSDMRVSRGFLLPPEVQPLVDNRLCKLKLTDDKIYIISAGFELVTSMPQLSEEEWWEQLRGMIDNSLTFLDWSSEALKRLMMFGDYVEFRDGKVYCGNNYEPFLNFPDMPGRRYEADKLLKIMSSATKIAVFNNNLILKNDNALFLVSPVDEA